MENLNRPIIIDTKIIDKNKPDRFALKAVYKDSAVAYQYKIDDQWTAEKPKQKPEGTRVVFDSAEQFRAAKDTYFAWQDIMDMKNDSLKPEKTEEALRRFMQGRTGDTLTLFVPWGVRIEGEMGKSEEFVLDRIKEIKDKLQARNIKTDVLLMPADLYATEVNSQVSSDAASRYFAEVREIAETKGFTVKPWSEIRAENQSVYNERASQLSEDAIRDLLPAAKISAALGAATRRSGQTDEEAIKKAAFAYLRERICEAEIVEEQYQPIKVSTVAKNKDNLIDRDLPRLYLMPDEYQFPWLK